jgi:rhodanese-related sulfurtransferase
MDIQNFSIQPAEFIERFRSAHAPLLLDVRRPPAFASSAHMIAGAQRCPPDEVATQVAEFVQRRSENSVDNPREVIVYCVYGHQVSHGAAALLRAQGWNARFLAGGIAGGEDGVDAAADIEAWRRTPLPLLRKRADLGVTGEQASRWVTRERPKIDRIACAWLIRRFIDPGAQFFFVPAGEVAAQATALGATAYDIPGASITHVAERCSFDALMDAFDLRWPALDLLARIVRGADTDNLQLERPCAGLLAITQGMARLATTSDHAMLAAMLPVYEALYAWCVDRVAGSVEPHVWATPLPPNDAQLRRQAEQARQSTV